MSSTNRTNNFGRVDIGPRLPYQGQPATGVDGADMGAGATTPPQFNTSDQCPSRAPASSAPPMPNDGNARVAPSLPDFGNPALNQADGMLASLRAMIEPQVPNVTTAPGWVNPMIGNLVLSLAPPPSDAFWPLMQFTCNSLAADQIAYFGYGWAHLLNRTVQAIDSLTARVIDGVGASWVYTNKDSGTGLYETPPGARNALRWTGSGWTETQADGLVFTYDYHAPGWLELDLAGWQTLELDGWLNLELTGANVGGFGRLTQIARGSATWTPTYDSTTGAPTVLVNPLGARTTLSYTGGQIRSILDSHNRLTTFTVDSDQNLTERTTPDGQKTTIVYDSQHRPLAHVDAKGNRTSFVYGSCSRVIAVRTCWGSRRTRTTPLETAPPRTTS